MSGMQNRGRHGRLRSPTKARPHRSWIVLGVLFVLVALVLRQLSCNFVGLKGAARRRLKDLAGHHDKSSHHHHEIHSKELEWWDLLANCPGLVVFQIVFVMCLSGFFETGEHSMRHWLEHAGDEVGGKILDGLFKEFTSMGFLSILLFLGIQSGMVDRTAIWLGLDYDHDNPVSETFEMVHVMIFMLLLVMLIQAMLILKISRGVAMRWQQYEDTRAFGLPMSSLESRFVTYGFLAREPHCNAPRETNLVVKQPFTYGTTWWERFKKRLCPIHALVKWRAFRHEFLFGRNGEGGLVPSPHLFSFHVYLKSCLGHTVLGLVQVSTRVWVISVAVICPTLYICIAFGEVQMVQCMFGWTLCAAALVISMLLAEDVDLNTPTVPEDPRQVLILFDGTSSAVLKTRCNLSRSDDIALTLTGSCPGLGDCKFDETLIKLGPSAVNLCPKTRRAGNLFMSVTAYTESLGLIGMWQAMLITSLIVSGLSKTHHTWWQLAFSFLAWAQWPVMMRWVVPSFIHQLTMLGSVSNRASKDFIRRVTLDSKQSLLGYQMRLVQLASFAQREITPRRLSVGLVDKKTLFENGLLLCKAATVEESHGFAQVFAAWDADNSGNVDPDELVNHLVHLMSGANAHQNAMEMVKDLIDYVDHDNTGDLDFDKCRALLALAKSPQHQHSVKEDLHNIFFRNIDDDGNGFISMDEFTGWFKKMSNGVEAEDITNLVWKHFGTGKPSLSPEDFVDFMMHLASGLQ